jgi:DNA-binding transcriptional regulator YhcF (GntR family)
LSNAQDADKLAHMSWAASPTLDQSPIVVSLRRDLRQATGPLRDHLASSLLAAVGAGEIPLGSRLPAERRLADALGVSRGTVVAALDQLEARGVLERRAGSGSYVRSAPITASGAATPGDAELLELWLNHETPIDLAVSSPTHPPIDLLTPDVMATASLLTSTSGHGYSPLGEPAMRAAAAARLTRQGLCRRRRAHHVWCATGAAAGDSGAGEAWRPRLRRPPDIPGAAGPAQAGGSCAGPDQDRRRRHAAA